MIVSNNSQPFICRHEQGEIPQFPRQAILLFTDLKIARPGGSLADRRTGCRPLSSAPFLVQE
jgi:hypothetical protein